MSLSSATHRAMPIDGHGAWLSGYLYPLLLPHTATTSLSSILRHEHHAELAEVPGRDGGPERLRLAHHGRGGHPRRRRPEPHHRHRHRRDVGDRGGDCAGAGEARCQAGAPGTEPQGGRGGPRTPPRRARPMPRRRPRRGAAARPLLPRIRPPLRQALPRPPPPPQPPHKQRGAVRGQVGGVGGRGGDDVRDQLPGTLPAHEAAAGEDGGDGEGHGRRGPRRQRHLHRPHLVHRRRRPPRLPPPRHPQDHAVRSDEGLRALQARQRAPHQGTRRPPQGDGRERDGELRPPRDCQDTPHPRMCRPRHQYGVFPGIQAPQDGSSGGRDDVLRCGAPGGDGRVGEVLRGLQRGVAIEAGVQRRGSRQAVELLRGHHCQEGEGNCSCHQLQAPGSELQRRPRHGGRLGASGSE